MRRCACVLALAFPLSKKTMKTHTTTREASAIRLRPRDSCPPLAARQRLGTLLRGRPWRTAHEELALGPGPSHLPTPSGRRPSRTARRSCSPARTRACRASGSGGQWYGAGRTCAAPSVRWAWAKEKITRACVLLPPSTPQSRQASSQAIADVRELPFPWRSTDRMCLGSRPRVKGGKHRTAAEQAAAASASTSQAPTDELIQLRAFHAALTTPIDSAGTSTRSIAAKFAAR